VTRRLLIALKGIAALCSVMLAIPAVALGHAAFVG
jgi:hypothetical protein